MDLETTTTPSPYAAARKAFHTATPGDLKGRHAERTEIVSFIEENVRDGKAAALYVSGAPGTGKTATINTIIHEYKNSSKCITVYINCMSIRNSSMIFSKILHETSTAKSSSAAKGGSKAAAKAVEKVMTGKGKPVLLFLDEMDQLGDNNNQDVLYTLFEWTLLPSSRLILVGVANSLDLTDRILPRLQARADRRPRTLNFAPYSQSELLDILTYRLSSRESSPDTTTATPDSLVDKSALLFCAKKVAAVSGDARKALDACRYAVEMVEKSSAYSTPSSSPSSSPSSHLPPPPPPSAPPKKVGIAHVMRVLSGVYENAAVSATAGSAAGNGSSGGSTLTLQQKVIICCVVLLHKKRKGSKAVTVGALHDVYKKVCQRKGFVAGMTEGGSSDQGEFLSILSNIEATGILSLKREKITRDSKINLLLDEIELEKALQEDRKMLATILQSDLI